MRRERPKVQGRKEKRESPLYTRTKAGSGGRDAVDAHVRTAPNELSTQRIQNRCDCWSKSKHERREERERKKKGERMVETKGQPSS
jgi:hypothetical protein